MIVEAEITCTCGSMGADPSQVRLSECHHRYWRGDKELVSVTKVIKSTWPIPPDFSKADPAVLENARERGIAVDALFSAYVAGKLDRIPAGTRTDAKDLFLKLVKWWTMRPERERPAQAQVILSDGDIAGTCDVLTANGVILDVKATYNVEKIYQLQLGAYADLYQRQYKVFPMIGILHVTERFSEPKLILLDVLECVEDWSILREMYRLVQRRAPKELAAEKSA